MCRNNIPQRCVTLSNNSHVKISEKGSSLIFENSKRQQLKITRLDGCVVEGKISADYFVQSRNHGECVVELKGCDVEHGVKQIAASIDYLLHSGLCAKSGNSYLVSSRYPRHDTIVANAKRKLMAKGWPLRIFRYREIVKPDM
jgi:hypothetical protein